MWSFIFEAALRNKQISLLENILQDREIQEHLNAHSTHEMLKKIIDQRELRTSILIDALNNNDLDIHIKTSILEITLINLLRDGFSEEKIKSFIKQLHNSTILSGIDIDAIKDMEVKKILSNYVKEIFQAELEKEIIPSFLDCATLDFPEPDKAVYYTKDDSALILNQRSANLMLRHPTSKKPWKELGAQKSAQLHLDIFLLLLSKAMINNPEIKQIIEKNEELLLAINSLNNSPGTRINNAQAAIDAIHREDLSALIKLKLISPTNEQEPLFKKIANLTKQFTKIYNEQFVPKISKETARLITDSLDALDADQNSQPDHKLKKR